MTVPDRLDILRKHSPEVAWFFNAQTLKFIGNNGKNGVACTIGKDATRPSIIRLALQVQSELRKTKHGKAKR